jgi:LacI family transcriptional regulator
MPATLSGPDTRRMNRKSHAPVATLPARLRVAVVVDISETFFREIVAGAAQYAREAGDWQLYAGQESVDRLLALHEWHGDGIIACLNNEQVAAAVAQTGVPAVAVGSLGNVGPTSRIPYVDTDNKLVANMAFDHLRERGLTRFGYYGVAASPATRWAVIRGDAFEARVAAAGCECGRLQALDPDGRAKASQAGLCRWLTELPKPVGIMACSDYHARHVLEACRTLGLRVPHDVAVIGVDDDELECELAMPPLTSIAQSARRIGHEAARLLDMLMRPQHFRVGDQEPSVPDETAIPPAAIVARASTETFAVADQVIARVIEAVRDRACKGLTIADLVDVAGMPRWKLEKRFKEIVGHSIHDDMVRVRLAETRRLIRTTDLPLKVVATRSGFHSVAYMTTVFRRSFGITPALFRRLEQGSVVRLPHAEDGPDR